MQPAVHLHEAPVSPRASPRHNPAPGWLVRRQLSGQHGRPCTSQRCRRQDKAPDAKGTSAFEHLCQHIAPELQGPGLATDMHPALRPLKWHARQQCQPLSQPSWRNKGAGWCWSAPHQKKKKETCWPTADELPGSTGRPSCVQVALQSRLFVHACARLHAVPARRTPAENGQGP